MAQQALKILIVALTIGLLATAVRPVAAQPAPAEVTPETGWWADPAQGGRGYAIESRGGNVYMGALMYTVSGLPTWYLGTGPLIQGAVYADLQLFADGTNLFFPFQPATLLGSVGAVTSFASPRTGVISFLTQATNNAAQIQRFELTPGGLDASPGAGMPENGWWWAPAEPGVGYFLEIQKRAYFLGVLHYANPSFGEDGAAPGQAIWDVAQGQMTSPSSLQASLTRFENGQALGGAYRAPSVNREVATLTFSFSSPTAATLAVSPGAKVLALERFRF
jgi:hypothetical protein